MNPFDSPEVRVSSTTMDKAAQRKALFRSRLRESSQNQNSRIDSPLVRYNESDKPVCRVCNVVLKSESLWPVHQASQKHLEAIKNIKAAAAGVSKVNKINYEEPAEMPKARASSSLPDDFFDSKEAKKPKSGSFGTGKIEPASKVDENSKDRIAYPKTGQTPKRSATLDAKQVKGKLPDGFFDSTEQSEILNANQCNGTSQKIDGSESKQLKGGSLPEGFFDNKDADLRARGIEPVKVDIIDALKEFEKEIHNDLQEVDNRLEEEEIDAAEVGEEYESLEQKVYREQVEMVKKQLLEAKAARTAKGKKSPKFKGHESSNESSSSDDEDDGNFAVDWRAKHL